jgi:hypothetical protein
MQAAPNSIPSCTLDIPQEVFNVQHNIIILLFDLFYPCSLLFTLLVVGPKTELQTLTYGVQCLYS